MQGTAASAGEAKLVAAHKAMLATRGLQFDFQAAPKPPPPPGWLEALGRFVAHIAPVLKYVFWGGVAVGVLLIIYVAAREIYDARDAGRRKARAAPVDWRPTAEAARALLEDADRLAGEGRYAEALHLLLFRSIEDLSSRRPGAVRPALTSRDIARLSALPEAPRSAFARIAEAVERSFFGGRPVGQTEFEAGRRDYETFAFAEGWR